VNSCRVPSPVRRASSLKLVRGVQLVAGVGLGEDSVAQLAARGISLPAREEQDPPDAMGPSTGP
jgi:hypothetical protein